MATINGEDHSLLYEKNIELETGGVGFYEGDGETPEILESTILDQRHHQ